MTGGGGIVGSPVGVAGAVGPVSGGGAGTGTVGKSMPVLPVPPTGGGIGLEFGVGVGLGDPWPGLDGAGELGAGVLGVITGVMGVLQAALVDTVTEDPGGNVVVELTGVPSVPKVVMMMVMVAWVEATAGNEPNNRQIGAAISAVGHKRNMAGVLPLRPATRSRISPDQGGNAAPPKPGVMHPARGWNHNPDAKDVNADVPPDA